jgi:WASH complex subunit strumpellin
LVARGSAIIAELLRLSDHVPSVFKGSPMDPAERAKYAPILFDFRYLKAAEAFDEKIDADTDLIDLDEEFRENHMPLLDRFYKLFESIHRYIIDLITYVSLLIQLIQLDLLNHPFSLPHSSNVSMRSIVGRNDRRCIHSTYN